MFFLLPWSLDTVFRFPQKEVSGGPHSLRCDSLHEVTKFAHASTDPRVGSSCEWGFEFVVCVMSGRQVLHIHPCGVSFGMFMRLTWRFAQFSGDSARYRPNRLHCVSFFSIVARRSPTIQRLAHRPLVAPVHRERHP